MKIDPNLKQSLLSLDDESLKKAIRTLAEKAGLDPKAAEAAAADLKTVRRGIAVTREEDLARAADKIGREEIEKIAREGNRYGR